MNEDGDARVPEWVVPLLQHPESVAPAVHAALCVLLANLDESPWSELQTVCVRRSAGAERSAGWQTELLNSFRSEPLPQATARAAAKPAGKAQPDRAGIEDILGPAGALAAALGSYEHRPQQLAMAERVMEAFDEGLHLMVEGGTGIGKSLAYLVPAVLWAAKHAAPVIVSTNTKNLQRQLYDKDLPLLARALAVPFKSALIKGRLNYLCLRKLMSALENADLEFSAAERPLLAGVLIWALDTETGDLSECPGWGGGRTRVLGPALTATGDECMGRGCRHARRCFLMRARARAQEADIVVANHALVFAEMGLDNPALPPYSHIVFDEAHNIEEAATKHFSVELSLPRLRYELGRLWRRAPKQEGVGLIPTLLRQVRGGVLGGDEVFTGRLTQLCANVVDAVRRADIAAPLLFKAMTELLNGRPEARRLSPHDRMGDGWTAMQDAHAAVNAAVEKMEAGIGELLDALRDCDEGELPLQSESVRDLGTVQARFKQLRADTDFVLRADDEAFVYWIEAASRHLGGSRAWGAPVHIGDRLAMDLYDQKKSIVFASATLSVGGSFTYLKKRTGLDRLDSTRLREFDAGTPFDYMARSVVLAPVFLPDPASEADVYTARLAEMLTELFRRTRGRALALFTSYEMLRETTRTVRAALDSSGIRILAQGEDESRETITEQFTEDVESVLMGTHSFWEGVDAMGETLSCLVVARLPFSVFTEPVVAARCEHVEKEGGNPFREYLLPAAVIRFRQGFGRLIRHRQDRGVVVVADKRIVTKSYGKTFQRSVPTRTVAIEDPDAFFDAVERFFAEVN